MFWTNLVNPLTDIFFFVGSLYFLIVGYNQIKSGNLIRKSLPNLLKLLTELK